MHEEAVDACEATAHFTAFPVPDSDVDCAPGLGFLKSYESHIRSEKLLLYIVVIDGEMLPHLHFHGCCRVVAGTASNACSSRSHCLVQSKVRVFDLELSVPAVISARSSLASFRPKATWCFAGAWSVVG